MIKKTDIKIWMTPETKKAIKKKADRDYLPLSVYINRLILKHLER